MKLILINRAVAVKLRERCFVIGSHPGIRKCVCARARARACTCAKGSKAANVRCCCLSKTEVWFIDTV